MTSSVEFVNNDGVRTVSNRYIKTKQSGKVVVVEKYCRRNEM